MIGRVTKIESQDVIFLEEDFPKRGEINEISDYLKWKILRQVGEQDRLIQLSQSKIIWDIIHLLMLMGVKSC